MEKLFEKDGVAVINWDESSKALCPEWKSFSVMDREIKEVLEDLATFDTWNGRSYKFKKLRPTNY